MAPITDERTAHAAGTIPVMSEGKERSGSVGQRIGEFAAGDDPVYVVTRAGGPAFVGEDYRLREGDLSVYVTADGVAG